MTVAMPVVTTAGMTVRRSAVTTGVMTTEAVDSVATGIARRSGEMIVRAVRP